MPFPDSPTLAYHGYNRGNFIAPLFKTKRKKSLQNSFEIIENKFYMFWEYSYDLTINFLLKGKE